VSNSKGRYLAFDIETAKDVPGEDFNWRPHRPLGICCAATLASDAAEPTLWYGKRPDQSPSARMSQGEAFELVQYLAKMTDDGYRVLTWNGLAFDFDVLAEESGARDRCRECALVHVDVMFHFFCLQGYPVGLDKVAQGMRLPGKPPGMSGEKAPKLWADGCFSQVLSYVGQDVRSALQIAQTCEQRKRVDWITRKGTRNSIQLPGGWLTVKEAFRLPKPDVSWMSAPMRREQFLEWTNSK
jgi:hypothetical protein